ncbi:prepilin-type N-terminal cleavage/methylation domain-containing protein [Nitratidesulfovibrio sp.]|uniref:type IV pilin protein n=1 Tax=Nitratidesulfovibrio sp. TaxID=2802297 RepID=UPI00333F31B4
MTQNRKNRKKEAGFTLIEIIAVLVILGVLAAVAVPKYFDLQENARQSAVDAAAAELQARLNQSFAQALLAGATCAAAQTAAQTEVSNTSVIGGGWTVSGISWTDTTTTPATTLFESSVSLSHPTVTGGTAIAASESGGVKALQTPGCD